MKLLVLGYLVTNFISVKNIDQVKYLIHKEV